MQRLNTKINALTQDQEGRIDKQIVKSLIISYLASPVDRRHEGERLLARFLDFNQEEMNRAGIRIGRASAQGDSFSLKFVEFLEHESEKKQEGATKTTTTGSQAATQGGHSSESLLARDLNKRLAGGDHGASSTGSGSSMVNPFFGHRRNASNQSRGSLSKHSSSDSLTSSGGGGGTNQLLSNVSTPMPFVSLAGTSSSMQTSAGQSISDVVRSVIGSSGNGNDQDGGQDDFV